MGVISQLTVGPPQISGRRLTVPANLRSQAHHPTRQALPILFAREQLLLALLRIRRLLSPFPRVASGNIPVGQDRLLEYINQDSVVNFLDISPFIGILTSGQ